MIRNRETKVRHAVFLSAVFAGLALTGAFLASPARGDVSVEVEYLTRGPIHEAFAQPVTFESRAAFRILRRPPAPIVEVIPEEKPQGRHVMWIAGYWGWDEDREDFIWVSGCWRAVPPRCSWVPGYWQAVEGGYEWIGGFWTPAGSTRIEYLPPPPEELEEAPVMEMVTADGMWVPGCWVWKPGFLWVKGRYEWRPGFWVPARERWVWVPAHYVYTPYGYVFVEGYWDRVLERRGVVFLPAYYPRPVYMHAGYRFSPQFAIDVEILTLNLFCRPHHHHYYFGDYYEVEYERRGIYPWYAVRDRHDWYDPIYVHQKWKHRDKPKWDDDLRREFDHRRADRDARPARNYRELEEQERRLPEAERRSVRVARPLKEIVQERDKSRQADFERVSAKRQEEAAGRSRRLVEYKEERAKWESPARVSRKAEEPDRGPQREETRAKVSEPPQEKKVEERKAPEPARERRETVKPPAKEQVKEAPKEPVKVQPADKQKEQGGVSRRKPAEEPKQQEIKPRTVKTPKSPVVGDKQTDNKETAPPPTPKTPKTETRSRSKSERKAPQERGRK